MIVPILLCLALPVLAAPTAVSFTEADLRSEYYADLGPAEIDVSSYPARQREQYALFRQTCARCHTLARAINSPTTSRTAWRAYMAEMRLRARAGGGPAISAEEARQIVEFLAFDSRVRKLDRREEFDVRTRDLQRRFWETIVERMRRLQDEAFESKPLKGT